MDPTTVEGPSSQSSEESEQIVYDSDNSAYTLDQKGPLFVMLRKDHSTPGTDQGWVYATLTPDGKTVTSAGRVASCMECHVRAEHGRLFGLPNLSGFQFSGIIQPTSLSQPSK